MIQTSPDIQIAFLCAFQSQKSKNFTPPKAASKYETLISTETPTDGAPTVKIAADPTKSTSVAVAPPCMKLPAF